jgi:hypothetical protein
MNRNKKKNASLTVIKNRKRIKKPNLERIVLKDGTVRFFGVSKAAEWLGCTAPALGMVLKGVPGRGNVIPPARRMPYAPFQIRKRLSGAGLHRFRGFRVCMAKKVGTI